MSDMEAGSRSSVVRAFLMCDIRGYSSFVAQRGSEQSSQLARRFADLSDEVLAAHQGELLGRAGDDLLAAFASPASAVRAAVALQARLLAATVEDPSLPLPAGIGLDVARLS